MGDVNTFVDRLEHYHYGPPPRGETAAADLDGIAAGLLGCGLAETDTAVRRCRMLAADARRKGR
jgi:hypothetical protein